MEHWLEQEIAQWVYVAPQIYFWANRQNCAKLPSLKCTHICLWLNPTGHSKFHNTSNHPPPATDSGRTAHTPLYQPVQVVPQYFPAPLFFSCPGQRNQRRPVPVPMTGVCYKSLLWMCTLNTLTWPDHATDIYYTNYGALAGTRNNSMGLPGGMNPTWPLALPLNHIFPPHYVTKWSERADLDLNIRLSNNRVHAVAVTAIWRGQKGKSCMKDQSTNNVTHTEIVFYLYTHTKVVHLTYTLTVKELF